MSANIHDTKVHVAMKSLAEACHFDNSESGSEAFLELLHQVAKNVKREVKQSHKDGLCLDCYTAMASDLAEQTGVVPNSWLN
jgi:hypothetical protein